MKKNWFYMYSVNVGHFLQNQLFFSSKLGEMYGKVRVLQIFRKSLSLFLFFFFQNEVTCMQNTVFYKHSSKFCQFL